MPRWAAGLVEQLVCDAPAIVSVELVNQYLADLGAGVDAKTAVSRLVDYGWLQRTKARGVYAFIPPGSLTTADPYVDLRAWQTNHPDARFCLAGVSAAWHLGYMAREPERPSIWLESTIHLPKGLRSTLDIVTTPFPRHLAAQQLGPSSALLRKRHLDILDWAKGLPAFGPEALLVQISSRPASFTGWSDLAGRVEEFAKDVDLERLEVLLETASAAARQRCVYLLQLGKRRNTKRFLPKVLLSTKMGAKGPAYWDSATCVSDHLVAPLLGADSKA